MGKKYYKNLKLIVCVGKDNLIGDRTPDKNSNGMLWHIKEELIYFKSKTVGNTVLFGGTTAKYVPVELMKKNPNSRRIMTEIWIPNELSEMALTPCVHLTQWSVIGNKLYLEVRQRSCDVALGLVANVFQYSVLHKLVALECGLEPAEIIWNIHNMHIYDRHYDKLIEQVNRKTFEPAKIKINNFKSIFDFKPDDIEIINYRYGEKVSYEVAI